MNEYPTSPVNWPDLPANTLETIIDVIASEGKIDRSLITPDATLETLGLASIDVVMILMGLEEALDSYIPMNTNLSSARNLADLVDAVSRAMQSSPKG